MTGQRRIWLNGSPASADLPAVMVGDRGFRFGDGVFEVLRARRGVLIEWSQHAAQLRRAAAVLDLALAPGDAELGDWCRALLEAEGLAGDTFGGGEPGDAIVRISLSRGPVADPDLGPGPRDRAPSPTVVVEAWPYEPPPAQVLADGLAAVVAAGRLDPAAPLAGVRSLSCADRIAARLAAARAGAAEAIFLTLGGGVAESASASVFAVCGSRLLTPPLTAGVVPLAVRAWLLRDPAVGALGLEAAEEDFTPESLARADEAFLADDVGGIIPLATLDGKSIGSGRPGLRTAALRAAREAWIDRLSRGEVPAAELGALPPFAPSSPGLALAEPAAPAPAAASPAPAPAVGRDAGEQASRANVPLTQLGGPPAVVPTRSSLLARSAALPAAERASLAPEQVFGWAAALTSAEILLLGRVVHEMLRTGSPPEVARGFGIAWDGGARLPRHDQEVMIREFAELEVTVGGVLAGRDLRTLEPAPRRRGLAALLDILPSRTRQSEMQASSVIEMAGEPAQRGLIALWNAWLAVRYRRLIPRATYDLLVRPWVTVVGPLPES
jgi:branched-chain amino acid aminotransferase